MGLRELKATWEHLGRTDPLWAVLTDPTRSDGRWDLDEFLATGQRPVRRITELLASASLGLGDRVLDFGCGVGRLTNVLAERAGQVVGVDIAQSMIEYAERINRHPDRVRFVCFDGRTLPFPDASFDSAVSLIALQHSRPPEQLAALLELRRVVRPGGALVLQIPSQPRRPVALPEAARRARVEILACPDPLRPGEPVDVLVSVTNAGEQPWPVGQQVRIGNHWHRSGRPSVQDDGRADLPHALHPGQQVTLRLTVTPPADPGPVELEIDVVQETVSWWGPAGSPTARRTVHVTDPAAPDPATPSTAGAPAAGPAADTGPDGIETGVEPPPGEMELHGLAVDLVRSLFDHCGCAVLRVVPDEMAGPAWESFSYVVRRDR